MNHAVDLLHQAEAAGVRLTFEAGEVYAEGLLTDELVSRLRVHKAELLVYLIARRHGLTLAELREIAGADWPEVKADPALLETLTHAVQTRRMREQGIVPPHYTATTHCAGCGPVPIYPGVPEHVLACPWCLNRHAGRPVPHPKPAEQQA